MTWLAPSRGRHQLEIFNTRSAIKKNLLRCQHPVALNPVLLLQNQTMVWVATLWWQARPCGNGIVCVLCVHTAPGRAQGQTIATSAISQHNYYCQACLPGGTPCPTACASQQPATKGGATPWACCAGLAIMYTPVSCVQRGKGNLLCTACTTWPPH